MPKERMQTKAENIEPDISECAMSLAVGHGIFDIRVFLSVALIALYT